VGPAREYAGDEGFAAFFCGYTTQIRHDRKQKKKRTKEKQKIDVLMCVLSLKVEMHKNSQRRILKA
jgi:hypothetical protein